MKFTLFSWILLFGVALALVNPYGAYADQGHLFSEKVLGPVIVVEREFLIDLSQCVWTNRPLDGVSQPSLNPYVNCKVKSAEQKPQDVKIQTNNNFRLQGMEFKYGNVRYSAYVASEITGYVINIYAIGLNHIPIGTHPLDQVEGGKNIINFFLDTNLPERKLKVMFQSVQN